MKFVSTSPWFCSLVMLLRVSYSHTTKTKAQKSRLTKVYVVVSKQRSFLEAGFGYPYARAHGAEAVELRTAAASPGSCPTAKLCAVHFAMPAQFICAATKFEQTTSSWCMGLIHTSLQSRVHVPWLSYSC